MRSASLNKAKNNYSDNAEINHEMHFDNKAEQAPGRIFKNCGLVYKEGGVEIVEGKYMQYSEEADGSVLVNVTEAALDNSFRMSAKAFFDFVVSGNSQVITEQPCILKKSSAGGYFLTQKGRVTIA